MAEGGGSGITTLAVLQSLAQARNRWGEHAADAIWDAATVKLVLGGLAKYRDLDDVARLLGEIDEQVETRSQGRAGERSTSTSVRTVPVMPPSVLRTLPFGRGVSGRSESPSRADRTVRGRRPADMPADDDSTVAAGSGSATCPFNHVGRSLQQRRQRRSASHLSVPPESATSDGSASLPA